MKKISQIKIKKEHEKMDPEKIIDELSKELNAAIKAMSKAKTVEEKIAYSKVVKNISKSLGVFFSFVSDMMGFDLDEDY